MEVSIIITNYNYDKYLARSIRSAINQSFDKNEYEIIVVDDHSKDSSKTILSSFSGFIRVIHNEYNMGLAASCNKAIRSSLGKYIIRLDADDYVAADWIKIHHLFLSSNKGSMNATSSDYYEVDSNEDIIMRRSGTTFPIACGIMYKSNDIINLGLYDESLPREDEDFRQKFLQGGKNIYNLPVPLYRYTNHAESMTKKM